MTIRHQAASPVPPPGTASDLSHQPYPVDLAERVGLSPGDLQAVIAAEMFDEHFYLATNPDVGAAGIRPLEHYLRHGRFENRRPSLVFDPIGYLEANPEVAAEGREPFLHYALIGRAAGLPLSTAETIPPRPELTREIARGAKRLIVFLAPGSEVRSGGVLSICAIYNESKSLADIHGAKVALCALPTSTSGMVKYTWFENDDYLLDLHALLRSCPDLDYLQIHIPEYAVNAVSGWLDAVWSPLLRKIGSVSFNILLQNIDLMEGQKVEQLTRFGQVTATTAHEAYSNSATRQALGVPVHKLSVRFGPELYRRSGYPEKKPVMVVSHDEHPLKSDVLQEIARAVPDLSIHAVRNMSYEDYNALVSSAKWALTFGEGLDFYFAETIFSGGNSFAVFNDRFFPPAFARLETVYPSWDVLLQRLPRDLRRLDEPLAYERSWRPAYELLADLYGTDKFRKNLRLFYLGEYTFP